MDSRERTFLALEHQEPDRVPVDCWLSAGTRNRIQKEMGLSREQFLEKHDVDLRYIEGPAYIGKPLVTESENLEVDLWGVIRRPVRVAVGGQSEDAQENYQEVLESPLEKCQTVEEICEYEGWPSPDWFDYSDIGRQCDEIRDANRVVVFVGDRLNRVAQLKPAMYLRGYEQIMVDMLINPEIAMEIFRRISSFYLEYAERILEAAGGKIDIFCTGDDFGAQNGPLISPDLWNRYLRDAFRKYMNVGHHYGSKTMHHTCGSVPLLVPAMIDDGLDILQSLQPEAADMDPGDLKRQFGDRLCFQGGISIQSVLPRGSVTDVKEHVRSVFAEMLPRGGYIACTSHNIQADTPMDNIRALFAAYHEFGDYGR